MNKSKSYTWVSPDIKVSELSKKQIFRILLFKEISPLLTALTRFFPFSLLWQDRRFHYMHKKITDADDRIIKIAGEKGFWFKLLFYDEDNLSLHMVGKFVPFKKGADQDTLFQYFRKQFEEEDFYINDLADGSVKLSFLQKK